MVHVSRTVAVTLAALAAAATLRANDRWEVGFIGTCNDDSFSSTCNEIVHGATQAGHDTEGNPDLDVVIVSTEQRHSYEARVSGGTIAWGGCSNGVTCPWIRRLNDAGGSTLAEEPVFGPIAGAGFSSAALRWIANTGGRNFVSIQGRITPGGGAADQYDLEFYDTTYFAPRFNNSATQVTVLIVQNTTAATVTGRIDFYDAAGALIHTIASMSLAPHGALVQNTSAVPELVGRSGTVAIAHTGGYGSLTGKAVAIEPGTGFTFDTPLVPIPY